MGRATRPDVRSGGAATDATPSHSPPRAPCRARPYAPTPPHPFRQSSQGAVERLGWRRQTRDGGTRWRPRCFDRPPRPPRSTYSRRAAPGASALAGCGAAGQLVVGGVVGGAPRPVEIPSRRGPLPARPRVVLSRGSCWSPERVVRRASARAAGAASAAGRRWRRRRARVRAGAARRGAAGSWRSEW